MMQKGSLRAILGPTNTGKTHYAVSRMLAHSSGMMGFPLRLLAREVYDKVVAEKGKGVAALITGEEKIMPEGARYFLCTTESLPRHRLVDFVAIDEVQMAADPQRGHIFTGHLLHTRGVHETLLLGSESIRELIKALLPDAVIETRPRYSTLSHTKPVKLSRLPRRSAVVGFSASDVYGLAELIRRRRGGAAIVMGALSPRTRNAQVAMYQSGEVDFLIATDAIGMGLNMDIGHISFAGLEKFDGRLFRPLRPEEAGQIAGRAGRYKKDGTFSTLSGDRPMDPLMVSQIEDHKFDALKSLNWRNQRLDFSTPARLIRSLEKKTDTPGLSRQRDALDLRMLKGLSSDVDLMERCTTPERVQLLWDVCQLPDFRKISEEDHKTVLGRIFGDLTSPLGLIKEDWIARQVKRLDNTVGDIDTLAARIAGIRVWTYVSHRPGWLEDSAHWAQVTRSVEDSLSDALHDRLTQRFVDRRTAVLVRSLRIKDRLSVTIDSADGKVEVEGVGVGTLKGFSFTVLDAQSPAEQKTIRAAALSGLQEELQRRSKLLQNVGLKTLELDFSQGLAKPRIVWDGAPIALLVPGGPFHPLVRLMPDSLLEGALAEKVTTVLQGWLADRIADKLAPLMSLAKELNGEAEAPEGAQPLSGITRGIAYRLLESFGVLERSAIDSDLRQMDQDQRKGLRRFGVRIGAFSLYMPLILKPHATELRLMLWAFGLTADEQAALPGLPTPGMVWVNRAEAAPDAFYTLAGFRIAGAKAVRTDMMERLADAVRPLGQNGDWFEVTPEIMGLVGLSGGSFADVMRSVGYKNETRQLPPVEQAGSAAAEIAGAPHQDAPDPQATEAAEQASDTGRTPASEDTAEAAAELTGERATADAAAPAETDRQAITEAGTEINSATEAEATSSDGAGAASTAQKADAGVVAEKSGEDELVERLFFRWAPARKSPPRRERKPGGGQRQGRGSTKDGQRQAGARRTPPSARRAAGHHKGGGRPGAKAKEKRADPNSPFAALAGLKDALEKKDR